jgi:formamidopyrimidine-DNA glycosylase
MPELPEVETVCRGLQESVAGKKIARIETRRKGLRTPFPADLQETCAGATIKSISRRAKYVLMNLGNDQTIILHLGMSGRLVIETKKIRRRKSTTMSSCIWRMAAA